MGPCKKVRVVPLTVKYQVTTQENYIEQLFTMEKYPRHIILQRNQSSQNSMSVTIRSRKTNKLIKKAIHPCPSAKCRHVRSGWVVVGGRGVWEGEDFYFPLAIVCPSLFYEAFLPQASIAPFSYFNHEIHHTYRRGHKIYPCSIMKNCPVSPT